MHDPFEPAASDIEGGSVGAKAAAPTIKLKGPFDVERHRGAVTVYLIVLLASFVVVNHICLIVMEWNGKKTDGLNNAFNSVLPVISGLVGSAITYYFTKGEKSRSA